MWSVGHREGPTRHFKQTAQPVHARTREDGYLVRTSSSSTRCGATGVQRPSSIALRIHAIAARLPRTGRSGLRRHLAGTRGGLIIVYTNNTILDIPVQEGRDDEELVREACNKMLEIVVAGDAYEGEERDSFICDAIKDYELSYANADAAE